MNRRLLLAMLLVIGALLVPAGVMADDPEPSDIEEMWPDEVPTPWFCQGVGPHSVCVPPW